MITANKYHPANAAPKNDPPVPLSKVAPIGIPAAVVQNAAAAKQNPSVAPMKITTKTTFVRSEQMRKTKESTPINTV